MVFETTRSLNHALHRAIWMVLYDRSIIVLIKAFHPANRPSYGYSVPSKLKSEN